MTLPPYIIDKSIREQPREPQRPFLELPLYYDDEFEGKEKEPEKEERGVIVINLWDDDDEDED